MGGCWIYGLGGMTIPYIRHSTILNPSPAKLFGKVKLSKNMNIEIELPNQKCRWIWITPHITFVKSCISCDLISINLHIIKNKLFKYRPCKLPLSIITNYRLSEFQRYFHYKNPEICLSFNSVMVIVWLVMFVFTYLISMAFSRNIR